jgi:hypothetical protein
VTDFKTPLLSSDMFRFPEIKMPVITPVHVQNAKDFQEGIRQVIQRLQATLKPTQELVVYYTNGVEVIRVGHIYMSSTNVAVVSGIDQGGNPTQIVAHFHALQFVCKVMPVDPKKEKSTIGFSQD